MRSGTMILTVRLTTRLWRRGLSEPQARPKYYLNALQPRQGLSPTIAAVPEISAPKFLAKCNRAIAGACFSNRVVVLPADWEKGEIGCL